jgi:molybdenum cofactor sulfurtransferase
MMLKLSSFFKFNQQHNDAFFNQLRKKEYAVLDKTGQVYLDYTGGNIYPKSLVQKHYRYLQSAVYGNPHSVNPTSLLSEKFVSEARQKVLDFFNAHGYYCIFTQNATGALQIVGECYSFSNESELLLTADNHNSVNGIREYCRSKGGSVTYCGMNANDLSINENELNKHLCSFSHKKNKLFAFPAQSNVSGVRHSLKWINKAQENGWDVLLDAAAFVPTSKLDLCEIKPDFVSISFYKMFGYPTGIGCLLVKKTTFHLLKKTWFAGGTILLSGVKHNGHFLKRDHEKFENGTVNYLNIPAITNGLAFINAIGIEKINTRTEELNGFILSALNKLKHSNGRPLIKLYGPANTQNRGGTFLMNFLDEQEKFYPLQYIEELAIANKISLRTGCFCNPGIDELNHHLPAGLLKNYFTERTDGDYYDFINFLGRVRGAVRMSIGIATTKKDIERFITFAKTFLNKTAPPNPLFTISKNITSYNAINTNSISVLA